jgi:hypothetical protein
MAHTDKVGENKVRLRQAFGTHRLHPGHYKLVAMPRFDGIEGRAATTRFSVLPSHSH